MVKTTDAARIDAYYCGASVFGYLDRSTARECEDFCKTHNICSIAMTRKAVKRPS